MPSIITGLSDVHVAPDMLQATTGSSGASTRGWNNLACGMQFGSYLAGPAFPSAQNLTGAVPAAGYTIFDHTDMQQYADLHPVLGTCFSTTQAVDQNQSHVNDCAMGTNYCCYNFTANPISQVGCFWCLCLGREEALKVVFLTGCNSSSQEAIIISPTQVMVPAPLTSTVLGVDASTGLQAPEAEGCSSERSKHTAWLSEGFTACNAAFTLRFSSCIATHMQVMQCKWQ